MPRGEQADAGELQSGRRFVLADRLVQAGVKGVCRIV